MAPDAKYRKTADLCGSARAGPWLPAEFASQSSLPYERDVTLAITGAAHMDTDKAWQKWGEQDPYFGVLSQDTFKTSNIENSRIAFMQTGETHVADLMERIERSFGPLAGGSALDFGCGVGRLVVPLARRFSAVTGVDVSDAMLSEARSNCAAAGVGNVTFVKSDDRLSAASGSFDLVHTALVLQHIPVPRGQLIIQALLDRLTPGGVAALQFSLARRFSTLKSLAYFVRHHVPGGRQMINLLQGHKLSRPIMRMNEYPLVWVLETCLRAGIEAPVVMLHANGDTLSAMVIGMKSKSPAR